VPRRPRLPRPKLRRPKFLRRRAAAPDAPAVAEERPQPPEPEKEAGPERPAEPPKPAMPETEEVPAAEPKRRRLRRPRLKRPRLKRPRLKRPRLPDDLWFRFVTRLRAVYYWFREKAQFLWRRLRRLWERLAGFWASRSPQTRMRVLAVAGVAVLYLIVKLVAIPGVPCQVSAAKECAPANETIAYVPENTVLYAQVTADSDSRQHELAGELGDQLPAVARLANQLASALPTPAGATVSLSGDILPWAKDDVALIQIPGPGRTSLPLFVAGVDDRQAAEQFLAGIAPRGKAQQSEQEGDPLTVYPGGFATAFAGEQVVFGIESAVRIALDVRAGRAPGLEGSDLDAAREELPKVRFAEVYLSRAGVQRMLAGGGQGATQLDTFVDYGATKGLAASVRIRDDGVELNLVSELDEELLAQSPTVFTTLPEFDPELAGEAGSRALAYVGVGEIGPTLSEVLATAGEQSQGLAGSIRVLARTLEKQAGVDPLAELLPALGGEAALVAEPTDAVPYASLIVDEVDEQTANDALARLQGPVLRSLRVQAGRQVPRFQRSEQDGVTVHSVQVSPTVNLAYAVFDEKLVVSTDPAGIAQVRADGGLADSEPYERATGDLPGDVSALVFLNLDELLGLAEQAGLAEDPLYASLSEDIAKIPSLGLAVNGSDEEIRTKLFLAIE
jgi:hypothetical protein